MKMTEARNEFLAWMKTRGLSTFSIRSRGSCSRDLVEFLQRRGVEEAENVTQDDVEAWRKWLMNRKHCWTGRPLAPLTRQRHFETIKILFTYLMERRVILADPASWLEIPKTNKPLPTNIPTEQELESILALPDTSIPTGLRDRAILEVAYATGLRREELADLDIYDVDLNEGIVRVRDGKGGKGRTAPLTKSACMYLARYLKKARPLLMNYLGLEREGAKETALWLKYTGQRLDKDPLGAMVGRYVRQVRPGARQSCHTIRHAFATHMIKGGAHIRLVQALLGHSHISSTMRYTHLKPIDLKAAHKKHHPREKKNHGQKTDSGQPTS